MKRRTFVKAALAATTAAPWLLAGAGGCGNKNGGAGGDTAAAGQSGAGETGGARGSW